MPRRTRAPARHAAASRCGTPRARRPRETPSASGRCPKARRSTRRGESYLPAYEETRQWKDRRQKINVPLFSGYVFARFHDTVEERIRVLATTGVAAVLGCGGRLEPVR